MGAISLHFNFNKISLHFSPQRKNIFFARMQKKIFSFQQKKSILALFLVISFLDDSVPRDSLGAESCMLGFQVECGLFVGYALLIDWYWYGCLQITIACPCCRWAPSDGHS
jgi:hypothetical protein